MKRIIIIGFLLSALSCAYAQEQGSDLELITAAVNDYIEGTGDGQPERLILSFDPDFNLYHVKDNKLETWSGQQYIDNIKPGRKSNRVGRILMIDHEGDAAMAKVEILMPSRKRIYIDYLMLLKYDDRWKVIHKSFTWRSYPEGDEN